MPDYKAFLLKLNENLLILQEREAKHGGKAPITLLNQIADHEQAIIVTRQAIDGDEPDYLLATGPIIAPPLLNGLHHD